LMPPNANAFMAGPARKRQRSEPLESDDEEELRTRPPPEALPKKKPTGTAKQTKKTVRELREIAGRYGKGPISYVKLAEQIMVPISLLDLFQISPDLSKAFRKLSTRVNEKTSKAKQPPVTAAYCEPKPAGEQKGKEKHQKSTAAESISTHPIKPTPPMALCPAVHPDDKAFKVPATLRAKHRGRWKKVDLPIGITSADQGSDLNLISHALIDLMGYEPIPLSSKGFTGLTMNTADGNYSSLKSYVSFEQ
jgi:hypothetical protein